MHKEKKKKKQRRVDFNDWVFWEKLKVDRLEELLDEGLDFAPQIAMAMNYGCRKSVFAKLLETYPDQLEQADMFGYTLLWKSASTSFKYSRMLIEAGANVGQRDMTGKSLQMWCKELSNEKLFRYLNEL